MTFFEIFWSVMALLAFAFLIERVVGRRIERTFRKLREEREAWERKREHPSA